MAQDSRDAYIEKIEAQLREVDAHISELRIKADHAAAEVKAKKPEGLDELRSKREKIKQQIKTLDSQRDEIDAQVDMIFAKTDEAAADAKLEYLKPTEELRTKREKVQEELKKLKRERNEERWQNIKKGVENSWSDLKSSTVNVLGFLAEKEGKTGSKLEPEKPKPTKTKTAAKSKKKPTPES